MENITPYREHSTRLGDVAPRLLTAARFPFRWRLTAAVVLHGHERVRQVLG